MSTSSTATSPRLLVSLALAPAVLLALVFGGAMAITQWFVPGTSGSEALVMSAVLIGLSGGYLLAKMNQDFAIPSAVYAASFATLLYLSLRMFWLNAPLTLAASGFVLIVPAALVGAVAATQRFSKPSGAK